MIERYVILNKDGGWLENTILWDGNTKTWQPPEGTIVKLESGNKKNTTTKKVIKDVFKYGKHVILENCEIALDELKDDKDHNFNKEHCNQTKYIHDVRNTVNQSIKNKNTEITTNLGNRVDLIL